MKNLAKLMLVVLIALSCSNQIDQPQQPNTSKQVTSIHQLELKANVDPNEFEKYVHTEIAPKYNRIKGQHFVLAKGDRGSRINKYAIILTFDTIEDRNRIYPHGEESPEDWGDDKIWEKLASMSSGLGEESFFTDYVKISE